MDIIDELKEAADMHDDDLGEGMGELEIRAIAEIRRLRAENARLVEALRQLADVAERCDSWESFPAKPLDNARAALEASDE